MVPFPKCKSVRGSRGMLPQDIVKLRSCEIAGNVYFSIYSQKS